MVGSGAKGGVHRKRGEGSLLHVEFFSNLPKKPPPYFFNHTPKYEPPFQTVDGKKNKLL